VAVGGRAADRQHRWGVVVVYQVSNEEAAAVTDHQVLHLHKEKLVGVDGPGCLDCEQSFEDAAGSPCPGRPEPTWTLT
jgi:hypothetical protein